MGLKEDIEYLLNSYSRNNNSITPDFILADYIENSLQAFEKATRQRDIWNKSFKENNE
jgi:hypothetical protein